MDFILECVYEGEDNTLSIIIGNSMKPYADIT